jgi:hypothetical protein
MPNLGEILTNRWLRVALLFWLATAIYLITLRWGAIHWFSLGDTDDNMRMMQVRGLLKGQDWFDLNQHRLNPPEGFNMHWSRLVDLPLAGLIMIARLFVSGAVAERFAIAVAPLLPLAVAMGALAFTMRQLVAPRAYLVAVAFVPFAQILLAQFAPTRIDHHGWQLAMLALLAVGLVDGNARRGGVIAGVAVATSFAIGIELLPYLLLTGGLVALRWILDPTEQPRLTGFGWALGIGIAVGYFGFAPNDNAAARCDALTPVWLSTVIVASVCCIVLGWVRTSGLGSRLMVAIIAGLALVAFYALVWPSCVGRLEGVSPELQRLWLDNISEARPIYRQSTSTLINTSSLPIIGLIGHLAALWSRRDSQKRFLQWLPLAILALVSTALLLFQSRVGAAAQILAIPGTAFLAWSVIPWLTQRKQMLVRVLGIPLAVLTFSGALPTIVASKVSDENNADNQPAKPGAKSVHAAKPWKLCPTLPALKPIAQLPRSTIFTFIDLGPRLITVTHHNAIAGPYHRNGRAILDVQNAFGGSAENAQSIIRRHGATYLLVCPGQPESTIYDARDKAAGKKGFYGQLMQGKIPTWLEPMSLPKGSPFKLWRIKEAEAQ